MSTFQLTKVVHLTLLVLMFILMLQIFYFHVLEPMGSLKLLFRIRYLSLISFLNLTLTMLLRGKHFE